MTKAGNFARDPRKIEPLPVGLEPPEAVGVEKGVVAVSQIETEEAIAGNYREGCVVSPMAIPLLPITVIIVVVVVVVIITVVTTIIPKSHPPPETVKIDSAEGAVGSVTTSVGDRRKQRHRAGTGPLGPITPYRGRDGEIDTASPREVAQVEELSHLLHLPRKRKPAGWTGNDLTGAGQVELD